jgi:GR25 family glycosyltransferase involved in LPS biosynthesis
MEVRYINVASQQTRRKFVERNFAEYCPSSWSLRRVEAVTVDEVVTHKYPGTLRAVEKACFQSHLRALSQPSPGNAPLFIAEDDVLFGAESVEFIEAALGVLDDDEWDIIYPDVAITTPQEMLELFLHRQQMQAAGKRRGLLDAASLRFAGATAYIVNGAALARVIALLGRDSAMNMPVDLLLREAVHRGEFRAHVIFPFATSLSVHAENSQIQTDASMVAERVWNAYRRLMWCGAEPQKATVGLASIPDAFYDAETDAFISILRAFLARKFEDK